MPSIQMSGYVALFLAVVVSRVLTDKANKCLSDEERLKLKEGVWKNLIYSLIVLFVLVGGFFLVLKNVEIERRTLTNAYFSILLAFLLARIVFNHARMEKLELNKSYRKFTNFAQIASFLGVAWFGYTFL